MKEREGTAVYCWTETHHEEYDDIEFLREWRAKVAQFAIPEVVNSGGPLLQIHPDIERKISTKGTWGSTVSLKKRWMRMPYKLICALDAGTTMAPGRSLNRSEGINCF